MTGQFMKKRNYIAIAAAVMLIAAAAIFVRSKQAPDVSKAEAAGVIEAQTIIVESSELPNNLSTSGTIRPLLEAKIAPKIMSSVAAVYVREGDRVRQGQVLIRLEAGDLQSQVAQAQAGLAAAQAGSSRADTGAGLQKIQTSTSIANAEAALKAAKENLSLVKEGPRKQQRAQAHLAVSQAEAQFINAELELKRYKKLYEQDVVPKQRLDGAQTAYDIAKAQYESAKEQANLTEEGSRTQEINAAQQQVRQADQQLRFAKAAVAENAMSAKNAQVAASQVKQAQASLQFARTQLSYATITSPISGVVSSRMVDPGDTVSPGVPIIAVQSASGHRLETAVPESAMENVFIGKLVDIELGQAKRSGTGKVSVISPAGDASSHKYMVKVDVPANLNPRSGEFGRMSFPVGFSRGIIIPHVAVRYEGGLPVVFVVDRGGVARMRSIKIGRATEDGIEILSGLHANDRVIISNTGVLSDGARVRYSKNGAQ